LGDLTHCKFTNVEKTEGYVRFNGIENKTEFINKVNLKSAGNNSFVAKIKDDT
jgi:hypothetical protein|tara:strand:+ start:1758 stop:1916 length:159 start_codon:yes stop_codon:yes gene_type:complete